MTQPTAFINILPVGQSNVIIKSIWRGRSENIEVTILNYDKHDDGMLLTGNLYYNDLKRTADNLEIEFGIFLEQTKKALTAQNGSNSFCYELQNNKFLLKKNENVIITYASITLFESENLRLSSILTDATEIIANLRETTRVEVHKFESIQTEQEEFVNTYRNYVKNNKKRECNVISKVINLVNSKKEQIANLLQITIEKSPDLSKVNTSIKTNASTDINLGVHTDLVRIQQTESEKRKNCSMGGESQSQETIFSFQNVPKRPKVVTQSLRNLSTTSKIEWNTVTSQNNKQENEFEADTEKLFENL